MLQTAKPRCPELSIMGNLYFEAHRPGKVCPGCGTGQIYEQRTKFGGMAACPNFWNKSPKCFWKSSPVPMKDFRCSTPACPVHHVVSFCGRPSVHAPTQSVQELDEETIPSHLFPPPEQSARLPSRRSSAHFSPALFCPSQSTPAFFAELVTKVSDNSEVFHAPKRRAHAQCAGKPSYIPKRRALSSPDG